MTRGRQPSKLRAWGVAIARRCGSKRARVAVARKLAVSGSWVKTGVDQDKDNHLIAGASFNSTLY